MYFNVDIRLRVKWCDDEEHAKRRVEPVIDYIKCKDMNFLIENPRIINVGKVIEHICLDCEHYFYEFAGTEMGERLWHGCELRGNEVTPYFENDCEHWKCKE